jgi:glycosyltransferase involved in cell wall biosynthesis
MRRLHVAVVGLRWPPEDFIRRKLQALAARGFRISVGAEGVPRGAPRLEGLELIRLPASLPRAARRVATARPDIVHFEWESVAVSFLPRFDWLAAPVVIGSHGGIFVRPKIGDERLTNAYPVLFERAAAVVCVADAVRQEALRYGLEPSKAHVIRTAVDTGFFSPSAVPPATGEFRVVAVGELNWMKGYDHALRAIRRLVDEGVPLAFEILGGDPPAATGKPGDRGRLLYLIHELGIGDRVRLFGEVSQEQVREHLRGAHVLLQSSLTEALPNTILEAMACALPVVVTDCGGIREAVADGVEGFVRPRRSPQALAAALRELHCNPVRRRAMGDAGRDRVVEEFTLERQVDAFARLYEAISAARTADSLP